MSTGYLFSSESVTEGHPDKLADQISDAVLDAMLEQDANSRVACETLVTTGVVFVSGEITLARGLGRHPVGRPPHDHRGRLHRREVRARRRNLRRDHGDPGAVRRHRGRRRPRARGARGALERRPRPSGRRRPGDDVRLRLPRHRRADADADRDGPSLVEATLRRPQSGRRSVSASRRQEPGLDRIRRRQAGPRRHRADLRAAPRGGRRRDAAAPRHRGRGDRPGAARVPGAVDRGRAGPRQPDGPVRDRRAEGRHRAHRPQDHRRHVRRAWRRTAAARSPARTRRRSTGPPPTWRGTSRRTSSPRASPSGASSRSPTRSAPRTPCR